jgi:hypothetical protein
MTIRRWQHGETTKEAWSVEYRDTDGRRRRRQFSVKRAAEKFRRLATEREQMAKAERLLVETEKGRDNGISA